MSFLAELKRRNVIRMGMAYALIAWVLLQAADFGLDLVGAPEWVVRALFVLALIGLPAALVFAWIFELTPEGIRLEKEISPEQSITAHTARKMDRSIILFLGLAVVVLLAKLYTGGTEMDSDPAAGASSTAAKPTEEKAAEPVSAPEPVNLNSIAVLPFANRSNLDSDLFFTDGIHDDLLTQLAKVGDLKVISRTSVMEYRGTTRKIADIAAELGVARILEGGVQRAGNRVRINAQLIDVATDEHLWAETFDRELSMDNIFDIQSEITRQIVNAVTGQIGAGQALTAQRPTDNLQAWEAYLHARASLRSADYAKEKYQDAETWLQRAVNLDPDFAEAWAELASTQMQAIWMGYDNSDERRALIRENLQRAVTLDPDNAKVIEARGEYEYRIEVDYAASLALSEQARSLQPGDAKLFEAIALAQRRLGRWDESIASFRQALELDPMNAMAASTMIETYIIMKDWDAAEREARHWLERFPESRDLRAYLVNTMSAGHGELAQARILMDQITDTQSRAVVGNRRALLTLERDYDGLIEDLSRPESNAANLAIFEAQNLYIGEAYRFKGEPETARSYLQTFVQEEAQNPVQGRIAKAFQMAQVGLAYAYLEDCARALALARDSSALLPWADDHLFGFNIFQQATLIMALCGEREAAIERIATHLDKPGGFSHWQIRLDPQWDFMRDDARFTALYGAEPGSPFKP